MAGQVLTSRVAHKSNASWQSKALSAATTVGPGIAVVNGVRVALPIIGGVARAAAATVAVTSAFLVVAVVNVVVNM